MGRERLICRCLVAFLAMSILLNIVSTAIAQTVIKRTVTRVGPNRKSVQIYSNRGAISGRTIRVPSRIVSPYRSGSAGATGRVYRLYDTNNVFREKAKVDNNTLDILSNGVIYRYKRARQFDTSGRYAYYNKTYDKVIRWPLSSSGSLGIGERKAISGGFSRFVFRYGHHIGPRSQSYRSQPYQRQPVENRTTVVVVQPPASAGAATNGNSPTGNTNSNNTGNESSKQDLGGATRSVEIKLSNSQVSELWVLLVDRRLPDDPLRIKIPPKSFEIVEIQDGGGLSKPFYELSVYRLQKQSMVIDRTKPGPGVVTEENYSPKSIGWFEIPLNKQERGGTMDVYRRATSSHNPGRVTRIDPDIWWAMGSAEDMADIEASMEEAAANTANINPSGSNKDGESGGSPFGVTSIPELSYRDSALAPHLLIDDSNRIAPTGMLPTCMARVDAEGNTHVEQIIWQTKTVMETVKREVSGRIVKETREGTKDYLTTWVHTLNPDQAEFYLADGSPLSPEEAKQRFQSENAAVFLQAGGVEKLDVHFLPILKPSATIIVSSLPQAGGGKPNATRLKQLKLPSTPVRFCGLKQASDGGLLRLTPYAETVEKTYTAMVTENRSKEENGKEITYTVKVPVTKTRVVEVWKEYETAMPPGSFYLYEMSEEKLSTEAVSRFATPEAAVFAAKGTLIHPWYQRLICPETVLLMER